MAGHPDAGGAHGARHAVPAAVVRHVPPGRHDRLLHGADSQPRRHHAADRDLGAAAVLRRHPAQRVRSRTGRWLQRHADPLADRAAAGRLGRRGCGDPGLRVFLELLPVCAGAVERRQQDADRGRLQLHRRRLDAMGRADGGGDADRAAAARSRSAGSALAGLRADARRGERLR